MKKLLIALAVTLLCCIALVACGKSAKRLEYTQLADGSYAVRSEGEASSESNIVIPSSYDGKAVTKIDNYAFEYCADMTSIIIPNTVTSIGDYAFYGCKGLTSIVIPDSVTKIGVGAFYGCESLQIIKISNAVTEIPNSAFVGCASLTTIEFSDKIVKFGDNVFRGCRNLANIIVSDANTEYKTVEGNLYSKSGEELIYYAPGKTEETFTVPNSVTSIASGAFATSVRVKNVIIPDTVTVLGNEAFAECTALENVTVSKNVEVIPEYAFNKCTGLISIKASNNLKTIEKFAFNGCSKLAEFEIPYGVTKLGMSVFNGCSGLKTIEIPTTTTEIGDNVFAGCVRLREAIVPTDVIPSIPKNVLQYVEINGGTVIKKDSFNNCYSLISLTVPDFITDIEKDAFVNCYKLVELYNYSSIDIQPLQTNNGNIAQYARVVNTSPDDPSILENVGDYVFMSWENVDYLIGYNGVDLEVELPTDRDYTIFNYAFFQNSNIEKLIIPSNVKEIQSSAFQEIKTLKTLEMYTATLTEDRYGDEVFEKCTNLTTATIPTEAIRLLYKNSIKSVTLLSGGTTGIDKDNQQESLGTSIGGKITFAKFTKLEEIKISDTVVEIAPDSFEKCEKLTSIVVDENNPVYASYNGNLYSKDYSELVAYAIGNAETTLTVPTSISITDKETKEVIATYPVTTIKTGAFTDYLTLTQVIIPDGIKKIESGAFVGCTELKKVYISNTVNNVATAICNKCDSVKFYLNFTEAKRPTGWKSGWNNGRKVYYYKDSQPTTEDFKYNWWHYNDKNQMVAWKNPNK